MSTPVEILYAGQRLVVRPETTAVLGRHSGCDVSVIDPSVSRRHAIVEMVGGAWQARDLGSRNGLWVNSLQQDVIDIRRDVTLRLGVDGPIVRIRPLRDDVPPPLTGRAQEIGETRNTHIAHVGIGQVMVAGRHSSNRIHIKDPLASRRHCQIRRIDSDGFEVTDLGSYNGTFVDGVKASPTIWCPTGSVIEIGNTNLLIGADGALTVARVQGGLSFVAHDLRFEANGTCWLRDVSLELAPRSFTAVLGPSGAGKSTLVKTMLGIVPATSGTVLYGGRDLLSTPSGRLVGYVPQGEIVHSQLRVKDALHYAARLRLPSDTSDQEIGVEVDLTLAALGIDSSRDKRVGDLSGGQRRRVSAAAELISRPPLLLLDEPTSGLDPGNEHVMMQLLSDLAHDPVNGRRVIVVTHSMESLHLCDSVVIMAPGTATDQGGRIVYHGPPDGIEGYFGVQHKAQVFAQIESGDLGNLHARVPVPPRTSASRVHPEAASLSNGLTWGRQLGVLLSRSLRILADDVGQLGILAAQGPLLGLLLAIIGRGAFDGPPGDGVTLLLLGSVLAALFLGSSNSVRSVVSERANAEREHALGVEWSAYIAAKFVPLAAVAVAQSAAIVLFATASEDGLGVSQRLGLFVVVGSVALAAVSHGILLSSLSSRVDKAIGLLPLVLLAMYLLSGGPAPLDGIPVLEQLSWLNSARWGLDGAFHAVNGVDAIGCIEPSGSVTRPCRSHWVGSSIAVGILVPWLLTIFSLLASVATLERQN